VTEKSAPVLLVPIFEPPLGVVYHLIVFPVEVAFRLEVAPGHIVPGVAETDVGVEGLLTVTVTDVLEELEHPDEELYASA